jgi:hypothetical protein
MSHIALEIEGGNKLQRELANDAILFFESQHLKRYRTLFIEIIIRKFDKDEEHLLGQCECVDTSSKPRDFTIELNSAASISDFIKTIFHEMVHLKQYAAGHLKDYIRGGLKTFWKKEDFTESEYENSPWEIEAYTLQEELYDKFMGLERPEESNVTLEIIPTPE